MPATMGEFGAVSVVAGHRASTNTMPLHIQTLYEGGVDLMPRLRRGLAFSPAGAGHAGAQIAVTMEDGRTGFGGGTRVYWGLKEPC